jgi:tetratricopeptide (TPR) repeat protein
MIMKSGIPSLAALLALCVFSLSLQAETRLDRTDTPASDAELWREYDAWRQADNGAEAHRVALLLVERAESVHGKHALEYGRALAELGATEVLLGSHDQALTHLSQAARILENQLPRFSERLVAPLSYLGVALQSSGDHDNAQAALSTAQHISHRLAGANNPTQIPIVYAKANGFQATGDHVQAEELQRLALKLHRIHYGANSPEAIEASAQFGTWLRSVGEYHGAIRHFHAALEELDGGGPDQPHSLPLLIGMAHAYRGGYRGRYARGTYQRILDLLDAQPDAFTLEDRIRMRLEFGDWLMQRYFENDAVDQYLAAWQLAADAGTAGIPWLRDFQQPRMIRYGGMAPKDIDGQNRYLTLTYDVTADGRPRRVKVMDHAVEKREKSLARKQFPDQVRFRPAIVDGVPLKLSEQQVTMYLLPAGTRLEPSPVAAPNRLTGFSDEAGLSPAILGSGVDITDASGSSDKPDNFTAFNRLDPEGRP